MSRFFIRWVCAMLLLVSGRAMAADKATPVAEFPVPPQQNAPWSLPEKVPDADGKLKAAVDAVFKLGLADPRGCAYHHVKVREGGKLHDARGWVLPAKEDDGERYAIGWNGLIYPVAEVGKPADLAADMEKPDFGEIPPGGYGGESEEEILLEFAATPRLMRPWAAEYLLIRLGMPVAVIPGVSEDPFAEPAPPRLEGWWVTEDRLLDSNHEKLVEFGRLLRGDAVAAFIEKKDRLAANRLAVFDRVWAEVERQLPIKEHEFNEKLKLDPVWHSLLLDAKRRATSKKAAGGSEIEMEIATWDEVDHWDEKSPPATWNKVVAAGPVAITPLLDCLDHDRRWTRAEKRVDGDGHERAEFQTVRDLAVAALNHILRFKVVERYQSDLPEREAWYADAAARMKLFCRSYGNTCGGELWFRVLANETADIKDQVQAAQSIVRPVCYSRTNEDTSPRELYVYLDPDARRKIEEPTLSLEGNQLRSRRDPSVMDLLQKAWRRARESTDREIAKGEGEVPSGAFCVNPSFRSVCDNPHEFMRLMEEWQPGNKGLLKEHSDWLVAVLSKMRTDNKWWDFVVSSYCEETLILRLWAKDESAMGDYEKLFHESKSTREIPVEVMRVVPEEPGMDRLAGEAFLGDQAPLSLVKEPWVRWDSRKDFIEYDEFEDRTSPLLVLPSVRRALIEALQSQTRQGTLVVTENDCSVKFDADKNDPPSPDKPSLPGTGEVLRLCDVVANLITPKRGAAVWVSPRFRLQDPLADRDRAIAEWIAILSKP